MLAGLESKQQALILGHAVPMPVVIQTAEYGEAIYAQYAVAELTPGQAKARKNVFGSGDDEPLV